MIKYFTNKEVDKAFAIEFIDPSGDWGEKLVAGDLFLVQPEDVLSFIHRCRKSDREALFESILTKLPKPYPILSESDNETKYYQSARIAFNDCLGKIKDILNSLLTKYQNE